MATFEFQSGQAGMTYEVLLILHLWEVWIIGVLNFHEAKAFLYILHGMRSYANEFGDVGLIRDSVSITRHWSLKQIHKYDVRSCLHTWFIRSLTFAIHSTEICCNRVSRWQCCTQEKMLTILRLYRRKDGYIPKVNFSLAKINMVDVKLGFVDWTRVNKKKLSTFAGK